MLFGIWLFLHLVGMAFWLGGLFTMGLWTVRARRTGDAKVIAFAYRTSSRLYRGVVTVGALLTILSGVLLMVQTGRPWFRPFPEHWLFQMQIVGTLAFLVTLFYLTPMSGKLARMAEPAEGGEPGEEFARAVKVQGIVGSVVGMALIYSVLLGGLRF